MSNETKGADSEIFVGFQPTVSLDRSWFLVTVLCRFFTVLKKRNYPIIRKDFPRRALRGDSATTKASALVGALIAVAGAKKRRLGRSGALNTYDLLLGAAIGEGRLA